VARIVVSVFSATMSARVEIFPSETMITGCISMKLFMT
jgi:hypothetical protein